MGNTEHLPEERVCGFLASLTAPTFQRWMEDVFLDFVELWSQYRQDRSDWMISLQKQIGCWACELATDFDVVDIFRSLYGDMESTFPLPPKGLPDGSKWQLDYTFEILHEVDIFFLPIYHDQTTIQTLSNFTFHGTWMLDREGDEFGSRSPWTAKELFFRIIAKVVVFGVIFAVLHRIVESIADRCYDFYLRVSQRSRNAGVPYWRACLFQIGCRSCIEGGTGYHRMERTECCSCGFLGRWGPYARFAIVAPLALLLVEGLHGLADWSMPVVSSLAV